jgi:hypothetical protein
MTEGALLLAANASPSVARSRTRHLPLAGEDGEVLVLSSRLRLVLRRCRLAGDGAKHEASQNPDRDLLEEDAEDEAEEKYAAGGELVHGGRE